MAKQTPTLEAIVRYNPATGQIQISIPQDLTQAHVLSKMLQDAIMRAALQPEPDRKVKTLDELGVNVARRA